MLMMYPVDTGLGHSLQTIQHYGPFAMPQPAQGFSYNNLWNNLWNELIVHHYWKHVVRRESFLEKE